MTRSIHDDLVATLGEELIAYSWVTWYHREARINPYVSTPQSDIISPHLDESNEFILQALEELRFSFLQFNSLPASHIYQTQWFPGGYLRDLSLPRVIFIECHIVCQTIRRQHASNVPNSF
jgi:hypothetical protein